MSSANIRHGAIALAATFTLAGLAGAGALAQESQPVLESPAPQPGASAAAPSPISAEPDIRFVAHEVVQPLPEATDEPQGEAASLRELIDRMPADAPMSRDLTCLAQAIYFEARGESLGGQLAVAEVVVNRAASESFPSDYCGVVTQRGQFSFVRGGRIPAVKAASPAWRRAKALARIAHEDLWDSGASDALFFHATYVRPGWRKQQVAAIGNHVFYR